MGGASAPPLCFLLLLNEKTFYKMGHIDELLVTKIGGQLDLKNSSLKGITTLTATASILAADSGKTLLVGPAAAGLAADSVATLPTAEEGLYYRFIYAGNAADGHDLQLNTGSDTNFFIGGIAHYDTDTDDTNGIPDAVFPDGDSNSKLNVLTPSAGSVVECYCDGTNWILWGQVCSASAPTFADQ